MMLHVVVLDPSSPPDSVRPWSGGAGRCAIIGSQAAPLAARHLAAAGAERVVLIARQRDRAVAALVANVITGAQPHLGLVRLHTRASLLGAAAIALQGAADVDVPVTTRLSMIERSLEGAVSGVWVKRVTRLAAPSPSFGQHLRSLFPGGPGFIALCGGLDKVIAAKPASFIDLGRTGRLLVGSDTGQAEESITRWYAQPEHEVVEPVVTQVQNLYGNKGQEFVLVEPNLAAATPVTGDCPVCDLPVHDAACPFCHVRPRSVQELSA